MLHKVIDWLFAEPIYDYTFEIEDDCYKSLVLVRMCDTLYGLKLMSAGDVFGADGKYRIICVNGDCSICH